MTQSQTDASGVEYDNVILIGRMRCFHRGHESLINHALSHLTPHGKLHILVGSANAGRSYENPFVYDEVVDMITAVYREEVVVTHKIVISPLNDEPTDAAWIAGIHSLVEKLGVTDDSSTALAGYQKDDSSYYLSLFPKWERLFLKEQWGTISATDIRDHFFQKAPHFPVGLCSEPVVQYLHDFISTSGFKYALGEYEEVRKCRAAWGVTPFPVQTITADAVVVQAGYILLVRRSKGIGKDTLALPGGHVEASKGDSFDNAIAEVFEEANPRDAFAVKQGKDMPRGKLKACYTGKEMRFDKPGRDPRGHYLTTAFLFDIPSSGDMWELSPDLAEGETSAAEWVKIADIKPEEMFLDHYTIIHRMLPLLD